MNNKSRYYRSAHSQRTVKSTNSSGSSRIPIKRNSSLRKKKDVMNQYKSGTDEEEPQTLVIERKPAKRPPRPPQNNPISQAEFDDMPLPTVKPASTNNNFEPSNDYIDQDENQPSRPPVQVKRPFLQRRTSPSKIVVGNNVAKASKANLTNGHRISNFAQRSPAPTSKKATATRSRSRLPDKRASMSSSSMSSIGKLTLSRTPRSSSNNFLKSSSTFKSTPNLATKTPPYSKRSLSQERRSTPGNSESFADFAPDAVPEIPTTSKIARTPPSMTRKVTNFDHEAMSPSQEADEDEDVPDEASDGPDEDNDNDLDMEVEEPFQPVPVAPPPTAYPRSSQGTAGSSISVANLHYLPLKTQVTLKSPLDGNNLGPYHKPEEFLQRTITNLASADWEANVNGMASVVRFARHHPEYLLVEYKALLQYVNNHVKNLRSQVETYY